MKVVSLCGCRLVPLMRIKFTWTKRDTSSRSAVDKKHKPLQAIVKRGAAQCIETIWSRCFCNYETLDGYSVFTGLCWYPRSCVMLKACAGALNWKRGHAVWGKTWPLFS